MTIKFGPFGGMYPAGPGAFKRSSIADVAIDVDLGEGTVKPWRSGKSVSGVVNSKAMYEIQGCCVLTDSDACTRYAEGNPSTHCAETVYRTKPGTHPQAATHADACNNEWRELSFPQQPKLNAVAAAVPANENLEVLYAVYTIVDNWGRESAPSILSDSFNTAFGAIVQFSGFPTVYQNGKNIRVYISRPMWVSGSEVDTPELHAGFYLATEFAIGPAAVTVTMDFPGEMNITWDYEPAPDNLWDITSFRGGQLLALSENTLRASIKNVFHAWPRRFSVRFYGQARRLIAGSSYAYVLTDEAPMSFRVPAGCNDNSCFQAKQINVPLPIASARSASMYGETVIYATYEGLVALTGEEWKMFPQWTTQQWQALRPETIIGEVHDGAYFFSCAAGTYRLDLRGSAEMALTQISQEVTAMHSTTHGRLLLATSTGIQAWNRGPEYLTAKWENYRSNPGPLRGVSVLDVIATGAYVLSPMSSGVPISTLTLSGTHQGRFKPTRGRDFGVKISTKGEVVQVIIAGSIQQGDQL